MKKFLAVIAVLSLVFSPVTPAFALDATWEGDVSNVWALDGNWTAAFPVSTQTATFNEVGAGGFTTVDLGAGAAVASIVFDDADAAAYTIGTAGQTLTLDNAGSIIVNDLVDQNQTIAANVVLAGASASFTNNAVNGVLGNGLLNVTGNVTGAVGGSTLNLNGANTGLNTVSGILADGGGLPADKIAVTKSGDGTWVLSGNNTYTGDTTITGGTLVATGFATALGGGNLIMTGGTLSLADDAALNFGRNTTVTGAVEIDSVRATAGDGAGTTQTLGTLTTGAAGLNTLTVGIGNAFTISGVQGLTFGDVTLGDATTIDARTGGYGVGATGLLTLGNVATGGFAFTLSSDSTIAITTGTVADLSGGLNITDAGGLVTFGTVGAGTAGAITITDSSAGVTFSGNVTSTTLTITDTTDGQDITFANGGTVAINTLTTAAQGYDIVFQGTTTTIDTNTNFLNTGTVTLGNDAGDTTTFTLGLDTTTGPSATNIAGIVETTDTGMDLSATTMTAASTLRSGSGAINVASITDGAGPFALSLGSAGQTGAITFLGNVAVDTLTTFAGAYNIVFQGTTTTIDTNTNFLNTGTVTLGNGALDVTTFTLGVTATDPGALNIAGTVATNGGASTITLGDANTGVAVTADATVGGTATGLIDMGDATLADGATLTVGTGIGNAINLDAVTGTAGGGSSNLTLNTTGAVAVAEAIGTDIGTVTVTQSGGATFSGTVTATTVAHAATAKSQFDAALTATNLNMTGTGEVELNVDSAVGTTMVTAASTLDLNGSLTGAVALNAAGAIIDLATGENITGAVTTTGAGVGTLNFEGVHTTGGIIGAAGNLLAAINIQNGVLTMDHNMAATTVTVDSAAGGGTGTLTLTGDRTITGDLTMANSGVLNLDTNILTVNGTYTQSAAAQVLNLTIVDGSTYGRINATGASGISAGTVNVTAPIGYIAGGTTFTAVNNGGGVTTVPTINTLGSSVVSFAGSNSGGDLILTAVRSSPYNNVSSDPNTNAAGAALERAGAEGATGDMLDVLNLLDAMGSNQERANAIETMTPDVSSGVVQGSRVLTGNSFRMISNRLGGARNVGGSGAGVSSGDTMNGVGVWMQGLGSHMKQGERKGIEGFSANAFGTTIGVDKVLDSHFRFGFAGSYGWAGVHSKQPGSPSDNINSFQGTLYASYDSLDLNKARQRGKKSPEAVRNQAERLWYMDVALAFTQNNYDSRREIWLTPTTQRVAKADHYAQQYSTNFELGYKFVFEETKSFEVTPFISLGYNYLYMNSYRESGADALNLSVRGEGFHQLEQGLGLKLAYPIVSQRSGTFIPSIKGAWLYDYIGDRFETTSSFAGGGGTFDTRGAKPAKSGMLFGVEMAFLNKGNLTVTGNWDIELRDQFMSNTYYGTVRYDF